jgi:hypothetical protein
MERLAPGKILRGGSTLSSFIPEDWTWVLSRLNLFLLGSPEFKANLAPGAITAAWCGSERASESEITVTEKRLGVKLPPTYRSFLAISNGWRPFNSLLEQLLPVQAIERLQVADPQKLAMLLDCYKEDDIADEHYLDYVTPRNIEALRIRYYPESILVGKGWGVESEMLLLNPQVQFPDGEWEAIFFANWIPGNQRYRSFYEFMKGSIDNVGETEVSLS